MATLTMDWPAEGSFETRAGFQAAVSGVIHQAVSQNLRQMIWVSPDWAGWPLEEPTVVDALTTWARDARGQLVWLAADYSAFHGRLARLMRWRRDWSHRVQCLAPPEELAAGLRSLLIADDRLLVQWIDPLRGRGRVSAQAGDIRQAMEWFDAISQRSTETLPVTILGI